MTTLHIGDRVRSIPFGVTGTVTSFDQTFQVYVLTLDTPLSRIGRASLATLTVTPSTVEPISE